jgi:hypothetical protein
MSIPLDRLYNFLHDASDHDIIIYRYFPHGSKNHSDLKPLHVVSPVDSVCKPHMLCHDQEPVTAKSIPTHANRTIHNLMECRENFWGRCLFLHSELNSKEIAQISTKVQPVYYWSHALIARDWFRYAKHDSVLKNKQVKKTFLIYNRAWAGSREYRLYFADLLIDKDLLKHCCTSFNAIDSIHYSQHQFVNCVFRPRHNLEQHLLPNTHPSWASADYSNVDYSETMIEVVLETLFDDSRWHLTEKILRPIACGQPFLLASTPGTLQYLRSYGFETFDPVIDESYDSVTDPVDRLGAITDQMKKILTHDRPAWLHKELAARSLHNQQRFFSEDFFKQVIDEYHYNLDQAVHAACSTVDCSYFRAYVKHFKWKNKYSRQDAKEIWLRYHQLLKNR